jgi:hypothetical protein
MDILYIHIDAMQAESETEDIYIYIYKLTSIIISSSRTPCADSAGRQCV